MRLRIGSCGEEKYHLSGTRRGHMRCALVCIAQARRETGRERGRETGRETVAKVEEGGG